MKIDQAMPLLGGLTPAQFMKRHWHKKPLLVRQAIPNFQPAVGRADLVALAAREDVESRLIVHGAQGWKLRQGPLSRRSLPPWSQKKWTFLIQGVNLHNDAVNEVMQQFRFVPEARLDDVMISYASDGGGVGPHFDHYDVFLLQAHGQRRWRIGRQKNLDLQENVPLKILQHFEPEQEHVLNPGDMLYLPPGYAHDGVAMGECMTWSIGFRSPAQGELARALLSGLAEDAPDWLGEKVYHDAHQGAVAHPAQMPAPLLAFAQQALDKALRQPRALSLLLGEYLSEPKPSVWFDAPSLRAYKPGQGVVLDRRSRMLYDAHHIFINGEGFDVSGRDAQVLRRLADERQLSARQCAALSPEAQQALLEWSWAGWLHCMGEGH